MFHLLVVLSSLSQVVYFETSLQKVWHDTSRTMDITCDVMPCFYVITSQNMQGALAPFCILKSGELGNEASVAVHPVLVFSLEYQHMMHRKLRT